MTTVLIRDRRGSSHVETEVEPGGLLSGDWSHQKLEEVRKDYSLRVQPG